MGDVAYQTKAPYCTECNYVDTEATWIESLEHLPWEVCPRFIAMEQKSAEVIVSRQRATTQ